MPDRPRLIIPRTLTKEVFYECGICGAGFAKDELPRYDRHMAACANSEQAHVMESYSPRNRFPFFRPDFGDVEFQRWIDANRDALIEKRKKM